MPSFVEPIFMMEDTNTEMEAVPVHNERKARVTNCENASMLKICQQKKKTNAIVR